jgi:hypothetical protein
VNNFPQLQFTPIMTMMMIMMMTMLYNSLNTWQSKLFFQKYNLWYHSMYFPSFVTYV